MAQERSPRSKRRPKPVNRGIPTPIFIPPIPTAVRLTKHELTFIDADLLVHRESRLAHNLYNRNIAVNVFAYGRRDAICHPHTFQRAVDARRRQYEDSGQGRLSPDDARAAVRAELGDWQNDPSKPNKRFAARHLNKIVGQVWVQNMEQLTTTPEVSTWAAIIVPGLLPTKTATAVDLWVDAVAEFLQTPLVDEDGHTHHLTEARCPVGSPEHTWPVSILGAAFNRHSFPMQITVAGGLITTIVQRR